MSESQIPFLIWEVEPWEVKNLCSLHLKIWFKIYLTMISEPWQDELNQSKAAEYVTWVSVLSTQQLSLKSRGNVQSFLIWDFFFCFKWGHLNSFFKYGFKKLALVILSSQNIKKFKKGFHYIGKS